MPCIRKVAGLWGANQNLYNMKDLTDLLALVTEAVQGSSRDSDTWFFSFSGHVNQLEVSFHRAGWKLDDHHYEDCRAYLTEEGIQELYWFIKNRI